jgi:hypothetical protein
MDAESPSSNNGTMVPLEEKEKYPIFGLDDIRTGTISDHQKQVPE